MERTNKTLSIKEVLFDMVKNLVENNPNDQELGKEVRKFINRSKTKEFK
jgi:hypothetical protein